MLDFKDTATRSQRSVFLDINNILDEAHALRSEVLKEDPTEFNQGWLDSLEEVRTEFRRTHPLGSGSRWKPIPWFMRAMLATDVIYDAMRKEGLRYKADPSEYNAGRLSVWFEWDIFNGIPSAQLDPKKLDLRRNFNGHKGFIPGFPRTFEHSLKDFGFKVS